MNGVGSMHRYGMPRCPGGGKVCFDKKSAQTQRNLFEKQNGVLLRIYQCQNCNWWRTSLTKTAMADRDNIIAAATARSSLPMPSAFPILRVVRFSAQMDCKPSFEQPPYESPFKQLRSGVSVAKRCFYIPNIRQSRARELILQFYPCPHCGFVPDILYPRFNRSGRV